MSTSASAVAIERPRRPHGQRQPATTPVGDYVGQSAAHAARAVRRAGLRPGLDRAFGSAPELTGTIVAQDPTAGGAVARNAKVTLYVAAPGSAEIPPTAELGLRDGDQELGRLGQADTPSRASASSRTQTRARRARRPRPASCAGADEPATVSFPVAHTTSGGGESAPQPGHDSPAASEHVAFAAPTAPRSELDAGVANMFADAAGELAPWRRAYPRKPMRAVLRGPVSWARSHPILAPLGVAMIAVWIAVAVAGSAAPGVRPAGGAVSSRSPGITAAAMSPLAKGAHRKPSRRAMSVRARRRRSPLSSATPRAARMARRQTPRSRPRNGWVSPERVSATPTSPRITSLSEPQVSVGSSPTSAPVPRPSSGGPFSP